MKFAYREKYIIRCMVVTISFGCFVAYEMQYILESAQYLGLSYYDILDKYILIFIFVL